MSSFKISSDLTHSELYRQFIWQQLAGDVAEDHLLQVFAKALGQRPEDLQRLLEHAAALEAHRVRTTALCEEALDPATDWASMPNPRRVELILSVAQTHPPPDPWAPSKEFCLFTERVSAVIGRPLFNRLLTSATKLGTLYPLGYESYLWDLYINEVDEEERFHNTYRHAAIAQQDSLVAGSDNDAFRWIYREAHCDECIAIALAKMPEERQFLVLDQLKEQRDYDYEDYLERQEQMINSYHSGW